MKRFLTYTAGEKTFAITDSADLPEDYDDYVWQWADSHTQAIKQHDSKIDEWQADPSKETY